MIIRELRLNHGGGNTPCRTLVDYLADPQQSQSRVADVAFHNLYADTLDNAIAEMSATQACNSRCRTPKTVHLLVSFSAGERPTPEQIHDMQSKILKAIGMEGHQCICVAHDDTDNFHFHMAISRINPEDYSARNLPHGCYTHEFVRLAKEFEHDLSLERTNHEPHHTQSERLVNDFEIKTGEKSYCEHIRELNLTECGSWQEIADRLMKKNSRIRKQNNGLIIETLDGKYRVKASTVSRDLSRKKLADRLGELPEDLTGRLPEEPVQTPEKEPVLSQHSELYSTYLQAKDAMKAPNLADEAIKRWSENQYAGLRKWAEQTGRKIAGYPEVLKKPLLELYRQDARTMVNDVERRKKGLRKRLQRGMKSFKDFCALCAPGNPECRRALLEMHAYETVKRNGVQPEQLQRTGWSGRLNELVRRFNAIKHALTEFRDALMKGLRPDRVTKQGSVVHFYKMIRMIVRHRKPLITGDYRYDRERNVIAESGTGGPGTVRRIDAGAVRVAGGQPGDAERNSGLRERIRGILDRLSPGERERVARAAAERLRKCREALEVGSARQPDRHAETAQRGRVHNLSPEQLVHIVRQRNAEVLLRQNASRNL